jgi:hypothetical protein
MCNGRSSNKDILSLVLIRDTHTTKATLGKLYINGEFFCYTLEDVVRGYGIKIKNETAIDTGYYHVKVTYSLRFKRRMAELFNVRLFSGIRMHGGNKAKNTSGCILVAFNKIDDNTIQGTAEKELTKILRETKCDIVLVIVNKLK